MTRAKILSHGSDHFMEFLGRVALRSRNEWEKVLTGHTTKGTMIPVGIQRFGEEQFR